MVLVICKLPGDNIYCLCSGASIKLVNVHLYSISKLSLLYNDLTRIAHLKQNSFFPVELIYKGNKSPFYN